MPRAKWTKYIQTLGNCTNPRLFLAQGLVSYQECMKTGWLVLTSVSLEESCRRRQYGTRWETVGLCSSSTVLDSFRKFIFKKIYKEKIAEDTYEDKLKWIATQLNYISSPYVRSSIRKPGNRWFTITEHSQKKKNEFSLCVKMN